MFQYRQVLVRLRAGDTLREIARTGLMGRDKVAEVRTLALSRGWLDGASELPDDAAIAAALKPSITPKHLADLLLPALYKTKKTPGRFATEQGEVSVHAVLGKDKTVQVEAAVYESGFALWSSKYTSQYLQSF